MAPSYGWGSTASRLQSHYEVVYFLPKFQDIPGTHLIDLERMRDRVDCLRATQWF